jgi:hypothetical protein
VNLPGIPVIAGLAGLLFKWNYRLHMEAGRRGLENRVGVH